MPVEVLNLLQNLVANPSGSEDNLTISGVTSPPAPHSATAAVVFQVQGGDVWVTYLGSTPSATNGYRFYNGQHITLAVGDWSTIKFIEASGTPVIHYTEKMYARSAARVSPDLIAALDSVRFSWLFDAVVRKTGRDPSTWDPTTGQAEAFADNIEAALREGIEHIYWPRLTWCEARDVSENDGRYSVDYNESGLSQLRHIAGVYRQHPETTKNPQRMLYRLVQEGIVLFDAPPESVYIRYRMAAPRFTRTAWDSGTTYAAGDLVYYATTGDCYLCLLPHTNQAPTNITYWERQVIPAFLKEFARNHAFAQHLSDNGDLDKEARARQIARAELMRVVDREQTGQGQALYATLDRHR